MSLIYSHNPLFPQFKQKETEIKHLNTSKFISQHLNTNSTVNLTTKNSILEQSHKDESLMKSDALDHLMESQQSQQCIQSQNILYHQVIEKSKQPYFSSDNNNNNNKKRIKTKPISPARKGHIINNFSPEYFNLYLSHMNNLNISKTKEKIAVTQLMRQMNRQLPVLNRVRPSLQPNSLMMNDMKFKKIEEESMNDHNPQKHQSKLFQVENQDQIKRFRKVISDLTSNLTQLKEYLNNQRKAFLVIRRLIGTKYNLSRILLVNESESLIEPLTEVSIERNCQYKEGVIEGSAIHYIDRFDFSLYDDLHFLSEKTEDLLLEIRVQGLQRIQENIVSEQRGIYGLQDRLGIQKEEGGMRYGTNSMKRYKPHVDVKHLEQKLGELPWIQRHTRRVSQCIDKIIIELNEQ